MKPHAVAAFFEPYLACARSLSLWATHLHIRTSAHEIILDLCAKCVCVFQLVKIYVKGFLYLIKMLIGAN